MENEADNEATTGGNEGNGRRQYQQLNPAALKRELRRLQKQLFALAAKKPRKSTRGVRFNIKPYHVKPRPTL